MLKLSQIVFLLGAAGVAFAQSQTTQSDSFHIVNCAKPCVAELALTKMPIALGTLSINGVAVTVGIVAKNTPNAVTVVVSFPASIQIQNTDLIVATYPVSTTAP